MLDVLRSGKITENITEDMIAKAVDDALELRPTPKLFHGPRLGDFQVWNNAIVKTRRNSGNSMPSFYV